MDSRLALPLAGLAVGGWALLPPYSGPALNTETRVEVIDHVVPGIVLLAVAVLCLAVRRATLPSGLIVALCGLWMVATHVPLVRQAADGAAPWSAVAYHAAPSVAVLMVGLLWVVQTWSAEANESARH